MNLTHLVRIKDFKRLIVKRIVVKDEKGKVLSSIPVTRGAAGAVVTLALAPWLAALRVIAGIVTSAPYKLKNP
jgi:hypothetical protein